LQFFINDGAAELVVVAGFSADKPLVNALTNAHCRKSLERVLEEIVDSRISMEEDL